MPSLYGSSSTYSVTSSQTPTLYSTSATGVITGTVSVTNLPGLYSGSYSPLPSSAQTILNYFDNNGTVYFSLDPATGYTTIQANTTGSALTTLGDFHFNTNTISLSDGLSAIVNVSGQNWKFNVDGSTNFPNYKFPSANGSAEQVLVNDGAGSMYWNTVTTYSTSTVDIFSGNGTQQNFTLTNAPIGINFLEVIVGGVLQTPTLSYTLSNKTLQFVTAPPLGTNNIQARYYSILTALRIPGPTGPSGPNGSNGATGPSGVSGPSGSTGPSGTPGGPSGPSGTSGPSGPSGPRGVDGVIGPTGVTGPSGPSGANSTVSGPSGATGPSGPAGGGTGTNIIVQIVNSNTNVTNGNLKVKMQLTSSTVNASYWTPYFSTNTGTYTVKAIGWISNNQALSTSSAVINTTPSNLGNYGGLTIVGLMPLIATTGSTGAYTSMSIMDTIGNNAWSVNVTGTIAQSTATVLAPQFMISIEKLI